MPKDEQVDQVDAPAPEPEPVAEPVSVERTTGRWLPIRPIGQSEIEARVNARNPAGGLGWDPAYAGEWHEARVRLEAAGSQTEGA